VLTERGSRLSALRLLAQICGRVRRAARCARRASPRGCVNGRRNQAPSLDYYSSSALHSAPQPVCPHCSHDGLLSAFAASRDEPAAAEARLQPPRGGRSHVDRLHLRWARLFRFPHTAQSAAGCQPLCWLDGLLPAVAATLGSSRRSHPSHRVGVSCPSTGQRPQQVGRGRYL